MPKTLVILQSNYIPWKGYFDLMAAADEFVIFDEVQFTRRDWRNRNKVIAAGKPHWLTIPVQSKGRYDATIDSMEVSDPGWAKAHWTTIRHSYARAPFFSEYGPMLEAAYREAGALTRLTEINELLLRALARPLGIGTPILRSDIVPRTTPDPTARLVEICVARGATAYISGPSARAYIKTEQFAAAGVSLCYANYADYPVYDQGTAVFEHGVSVIDTLMRCGLQTRSHLKSPHDRAAFLDQP